MHEGDRYGVLHILVTGREGAIETAQDPRKELMIPSVPRLFAGAPDVADEQVQEQLVVLPKVFIYYRHQLWHFDEKRSSKRLRVHRHNLIERHYAKSQRRFTR